MAQVRWKKILEGKRMHMRRTERAGYGRVALKAPSGGKTQFYPLSGLGGMAVKDFTTLTKENNFSSFSQT